ncbi:MAG: winged helix-turn-helix transcriptional regulator [Candidatus Liptonbacteria bacterium]|nr:winged helix-turn-helix transcriptional regulator [Candidatus Liptonbacteria bacterium]
MKELERTLKMLANRRRLAILKYLKRTQEAPVAEIAHKINLSFKATSKHLTLLASADIVEKDQRSLQMFYRLALMHKSTVRHVLSLL